MMSIYIPRVFINIDEPRIKDIFETLYIGNVDHVEFTYKNGKGSPYYSAYVYFKQWYNTTSAKNLIEKIKNPEKEAKIVYDDPWYWIVFENKSVKKQKQVQQQQYEEGEIKEMGNTNKEGEIKERGNKAAKDKKYVRKQRICINQEQQQQFEKTLKEDENGMTEEDYQRCEDYFNSLDLEQDDCERMILEQEALEEFTAVDFYRCEEYFEGDYYADVDGYMTHEDYMRCEQYFDSLCHLNYSEQMNECFQMMQYEEMANTFTAEDYYNMHLVSVV